MPIPRDKVLHFATGAAGGFVFGMGFGFRFGVVSVACVGVLKELLDAWQNFWARRAGIPAPHSVELLDAVATALGGVAGALLAVLVQREFLWN